MPFEKLCVLLQHTRCQTSQFSLLWMICKEAQTLRNTCWRGLLTKNSRKVWDKRRWRIGRGEGWRVGRREHTCWSWWETWENIDSFFLSNIYWIAICVSNTCVKNWAIVMKTTDHAKGVLQTLPPLLHYRFMTLYANTVDPTSILSSKSLRNWLQLQALIPSNASNPCLLLSV